MGGRRNGSELRICFSKLLKQRACIGYSFVEVIITLTIFFSLFIRMHNFKGTKISRLDICYGRVSTETHSEGVAVTTRKVRRGKKDVKRGQEFRD